MILGAAGDDVLHGEGGGDYLDGGKGQDAVFGGQGDDQIFGRDGNDKLIGQAGNDQLEGGLGSDALEGGDGIATASYAQATSGVTADLFTPSNNSGEAVGDTYKSIENLVGSCFNDQLVGNNSANVLNGGDGDDTLVGKGGNDTLIGGTGADTLMPGNGAHRGAADRFAFQVAYLPHHLDDFTLRWFRAAIQLRKVPTRHWSDLHWKVRTENLLWGTHRVPRDSVRAG